MQVNFDAAYRAVQTRDPRFDGQFFTAVKTTGIYCRPACPARTPLPRNVTFFPTAAAAQAAGYRPCRRCLPDAAPGSPEWNLRADTVGAAMRLIGDGVVDREGIPGLAGRLGYTPRHLGRILQAEVGASPLALARARRAHLARVLLTTTRMKISDIAFAAGFASIRQFNDTIVEVFGLDPTALRGRRPPHPAVGPVAITAGALRLRLQLRAPFAASHLLAFLAARAVPEVEWTGDRSYVRSLRLPGGLGTVRLDLPPDGAARPVVEATIRLQDLSDLGPAIDRCRRLLDADADPARTDQLLAMDPALAAAVAARPGLRVPGAVDGPEILVRALVGQQISIAAARAGLGKLAALAGPELPAGLIDPAVPIRRVFPAPAELATLSPGSIAGPASRTTALLAVTGALAAGDLVVDSGRRTADLTADLVSRQGIGPWTAGYVAMRVLGDPDVLLTSDLALRQGAAALGLPDHPADLAERAERWRPFRSYAGMHLWQAAVGRIRQKGHSHA